MHLNLSDPLRRNVLRGALYELMNREFAHKDDAAEPAAARASLTRYMQASQMLSEIEQAELRARRAAHPAKQD